MLTNLDKYKSDLKHLITRGGDLLNAIQFECYPGEFKKEFERHAKKKSDFAQFAKTLPSFKQEYQRWYSESLVIIKQLLPDRLSDFIKLYEKPKNRKGVADVPPANYWHLRKVGQECL